jgi:ribosomal protein S1
MLAALQVGAVVQGTVVADRRGFSRVDVGGGAVLKLPSEHMLQPRPRIGSKIEVRITEIDAESGQGAATQLI